MKLLVAALTLLAGPTLAASVVIPGQTILIDPPAYSVAPPAVTVPSQAFKPPSYTVNPPAFSTNLPAQTITIPDGTGGVGPAGPQGPAGPAGATGPAGPAADLTAITARVTALETAVAALKGGTGGTTPPPPTSLNDPCAGRTSKWASLSLTNADNIAASFACVAPGSAVLTLAAGRYPQVFNIGAGTGLTNLEIIGAGAAKTVIDGQGGCLVNKNDSSCATRLAFGNGVVRTEVPLYIHDLELTGGGTNATDGHDGQAGLYVAVPNGTVTARRVMFRKNQDGLFCNAGLLTGNTDVVVDLSDFTKNSVDGGSHDSYCSGKGSLTITNSNAYGSLHGNVFKTRMGKVTLTNDFIFSSDPSNTGEGGRFVDAADGAILAISNSTLVGNTCCSPHLGNGEESTSMQASPTTTITNTKLYIFTPADFQSPGPVTFSGVTVNWGTSGRGNGSISNSAGGAVSGVTAGSGSATPPAPPPTASGAVL